MVFLPKKLKLSSIDSNKSETISEKIIQVNLTNLYYIKLYIIISPYFFKKGMNTCYFLNLSIITKGYIHQFNHFWISDHLQLIVIKEIYNQIIIGHLGYQKTISLII